MRVGEVTASARLDPTGVQKGVAASKKAMEELMPAANRVTANVNQAGGAIKNLADRGKALIGSLGAPAMAEATSAAHGLAAALGPAGTMLVALGPIGLAAGATMGGLALALGSVTRSAIEYADKIDIMSQRTGFGAQGLQQLDYAARLTNTSLDAVTGAASKMQATLALAPDKFAAMGLQASELRALKPEEQFFRVADAIGKVNDQAQKMALAREVFGRSAAELLPLINNMRGLRQAADDAGYALGDRTLAGLVKVDDQLDRVGPNFDALKRNIGGLVATALPLETVFGSVASGIALVSKELKELQESPTGKLEMLLALGTGGISLAAGRAISFAQRTRDEQVAGYKAPTVFGGQFGFNPGATALGVSGPTPEETSRNQFELDAALLKRTQGEREATEAASALAKSQREADAKQKALAMRMTQLFPNEMVAAGLNLLGVTNGLAQAMAAAASGGAGASPWAGRLGGGGSLADRINPMLKLPERPDVWGDRLGGPSIADIFNKKAGKTFGGAGMFDGLLAGLPQAIMGAIQGGGNIGGSIGGLLGGSMLGESTKFVKGLTGQLSGALGPALGGALGSALPGIGTMIGSVLLPKVLGIFSGTPAWVKAGKEAGKTLGVGVSDELAKAILADSKKLGISVKDASLLALPQAMQASGKDAREFAGQTSSLLKAIQSGAVPAARGLESVGKAFSGIKDAAMNAGVIGDRALRQVIDAARETGQKIPEIAAFVGEQLATAATGTGAGVAGIKIYNEADLRAQASIAGLTFWATVKEKGLIAAADAMSEPIAKLREELDKFGGDSAAAAILGPIIQASELAKNELFRGAAEGAKGFADALGGIANASLPMTIDQFRAFEQQANSAFEQAKAGALEQGLSAEEAAKQALLATGPLLQNITQASSSYGIALDGNTAKLMEQARAAGVAFPVDSTTRLTSSIDALTLALGGIPPKFEEIGAAMGRIPTTIPIDVQLGVSGGGGAVGIPGGVDAAVLAGAMGQFAPTRIDGASSAGGFGRAFAPTRLTSDTLFQAHAGEDVLIVPKAMRSSTGYNAVYPSTGGDAVGSRSGSAPDLAAVIASLGGAGGEATASALEEMAAAIAALASRPNVMVVDGEVMATDIAKRQERRSPAGNRMRRLAAGGY